MPSQHPNDYRPDPRSRRRRSDGGVAGGEGAGKWARVVARGGVDDLVRRWQRPGRRGTTAVPQGPPGAGGATPMVVCLGHTKAVEAHIAVGADAVAYRCII